MNRMLVQMRALPLYGQVTVADVGTSDLPDWETGEERAISTEHAVAVATRSDSEGDVTITVFEGRDRVGLGDVVFEGEISLTSHLLEVGNSLAATIAHADVGRAGYLRLRIFVEPANIPEKVTILIGPAT